MTGASAVKVVVAILLPMLSACGGAGGPESSDQAYCQLFVHRSAECFSPKPDDLTREDKVTECRAGRVAARALGRWDDEERREVTGCLQKPDCDSVAACMAQGPPQ